MNYRKAIITKVELQVNDAGLLRWIV